MKILHICLAAFYIDNYTYQENMLTKYHKKLGYDVEILASLVTFDVNGEFTLLNEADKYYNEHGIQVTRLNYKRGFQRLRKYKGTYDAISRINPDIIFIHGCQFLDIDKVVKYVEKNPSVKIYVDNHADYSNSATNWLSHNILHKKIWRSCARKIEPYTSKFYGVLPARVDFLKNVYKIPEEKVELLVMGADDEKVEEVSSVKKREKTRSDMGVDSDDFLIITGGKIDKAKLQTFDLIKALNKIENNKLKLVIFGSVIEELKEPFFEMMNDDKIQYIGWLNTDESYKYFEAADLAVFPGRHSVYWEQVVGQGLPLLVKYWDGTTHVNVGGNCKFLYKDSEDEIRRNLESIIGDDQLYNSMKEAAVYKSKSMFSYEEIAKRSII